MYYATHKINLAPVGGVCYTAERRLRGVRFYTGQSPFGGVRYTANWGEVNFALYVRYCANPKINLPPIGGVSYTAERQLRNVDFTPRSHRSAV